MTDGTNGEEVAEEHGVQGVGEDGKDRSCRGGARRAREGLLVIVTDAMLLSLRSSLSPHLF